MRPGPVNPGHPGRTFHAGVGLLATVWPASASAHASERMVILTLPTGMYILAAAVTVGLTAAIGLRTSRLPDFSVRKVFEWRASRPHEMGSLVSAVLLGVLIAIGLLGSRDPFENLLPLCVWTLFWIGLPLACVLVGNLWKPINPWTGPARLTRRMLGYRGTIGLSRLGFLPAVLGYFAFAWFEIISLRPDDPAVLAKVVASYWLSIFILAVAEGEHWLETGEGLTVFFGFISKIAPFWTERGNRRIALMTGPPGAQVLRMSPLPAGAVAFVTLVLAGVTFDGLADTFWWLARIGVNPLEFPGRSAVVGVNTAGLLGAWATIAITSVGAIWLGLRMAGQQEAFGSAQGLLLLSFLPIAAGYHIAHYLSALLTQGQYLIAALNDPLGRGWALLGLAQHWESFGFLNDRFWVHVLWGSQVSIILGAHLLAVLLSLKLAQRLDIRISPLAHLPVTAMMVVYTVLGLWLLSTPTGA